MTEAEKERRRAYQRDWARKWRAANPDKVREANQRGSSRQRQWVADHPTETANHKRAWEQRNLEQARAASRKWRTEHPEWFQKYRRDWYEKNIDRAREIYRLNQHRRRTAPGVLTVEDVLALYAKQRGLCALCEADISGRRYHVDHIIPITRGGSNGPDNRQLLCPPCNRRKGAKLPS